MPLYDYVCKECGTQQEKWHKMDEQNTEKCEKCGAEPEKLVKELPAVSKHGSWSRWNVV